MSTIQHFSAVLARPGRSIGRRAFAQFCSCDRVLRATILGLDCLLRRLLGIFEFSSSPRCLLRIAIARAPAGLLLPGGTRVRHGCALIELHLWNEHVSALLAGKSDFGQAKCILRDLRYSLGRLALYVGSHPETVGRADFVHARIALSLDDRPGKLESFARAFGFRVTCLPPRGMTRVHDYFEDFLIRWLLRVFNPRWREKRRVRLRRAELWMPRACLLERYADPPVPALARTEEPVAAASASR